jgi:flagellar biosynthesis/type III secretory pathway M-ring protein FliF/YscJ
MEKYSGQSTGKYSKLQFIIVYKTDKGVIFDENVSAGSYYRLNKGDKLTLERTPFDIKQTPKENLLVFVRGIFGIISVMVIFLMLWFISVDCLKYFKRVSNDTAK